MKQPLFGTDGIRRKMGEEPLTPDSLVKLGKALGKWISTKFKNKTVALAHDTRASAGLCKAALTTGLLQYPVTVHDCLVLPTPVLYHRVNEFHYDVGIMITASHNLAEDNGIKIFTNRCGKLSLQDEAEITTIFNELSTAHEEPLYTSLGKEEVIPDAGAFYKTLLHSHFKKDFLKHTSVVVDCAHGAYFTLAPDILRSFGAIVTEINTNPDGHNINQVCGSLHPDGLVAMVKKQSAHIGFAFDGDGDRIVVSNKNGVLKDGDDILALLLEHPRYRRNDRVVGTVMCNQGLAQHLAQHGRTLLRTPVGDKYVVAKMKEEELTLGGEPSGHIILRDSSEVADGLFTALRILETTCQKECWELTTFTKFPQCNVTIPVTEKKDLTESPFAQIIADSELALQGGRVLVRYSGTEPLLRVMVEGPDAKQAEDIITHLAASLTLHLT